MRHERDDGLDTVDWLRRQPWFTGVLGTFGPSYVGYTQWAIADVPELAAMATVVTASHSATRVRRRLVLAVYHAGLGHRCCEAQRPWLASTRRGAAR